MSSVLDIPIVDVMGLTETDEDLQKPAAQIKDAFTNIGFVGIKNHNISKEDVKIAWDNVGQFLELPEKIKFRYKQDVDNKICGWSPLGGQILYNLGTDTPSAADYKETLNIDHKSFNWPSEVPGLEETTMTMIEKLSTLGEYVLRLMAIALNLQDRTYFSKCHNIMSNDNPTSIRFAQYPPIPEGGLVKGQMRCGEHTDWTSITLLIQDEYGGLEVQRRDGSWIETQPPYGTVMVNVGDMMQRWTSDRFVSTNHRVREPTEDHLRRRTRRSLVYFVSPDNDTMVSSLDGSNKYPPISASEYLWQRARQHNIYVK